MPDPDLAKDNAGYSGPTAGTAEDSGSEGCLWDVFQVQSDSPNTLKGIHLRITGLHGFCWYKMEGISLTFMGHFKLKACTGFSD